MRRNSVLEDALRRLLAETGSAETPTGFVLPAHGAGGLRAGVDLEDRDALADLLGENAATLTRAG